MSGSLTIGELTAFFSYIWYLVIPLQQLGYQINNLTQSIASGQRILEILDTPRGIRDSRDAVDIGRIEGPRQALTMSPSATKATANRRSTRSASTSRPGSVVGILGRRAREKARSSV